MSAALQVLAQPEFTSSGAWLLADMWEEDPNESHWHGPDSPRRRMASAAYRHRAVFFLVSVNTKPAKTTEDPTIRRSVRA